MWRKIGIALALTFIVTFSLRRVAGVDLPFGASALIYLALYVAVAVVGARFTNRRDATERPDIPLSGPVGQRGAATLTARFTATSLLSLLNPRLLWQQIQQLGGQLMLSVQRRGQLPSITNTQSSIRYTLPFCGEWMALNGGVTKDSSHSWDILTQRYAYDFVVVDEALRRHTGDGTDLADYFCYGLPIIAVAAGEVVAMRNDVRDAPRVGHGWADFGGRDFRGNYVTIRHAEREYSVYAHLIPGSVAVDVGDTVAQGQPIGRCGHSGFSTEPHLHFHFQDGPDFFTAAGVPLPFADVAVDGGPVSAEAIYVTRLTRLRNIAYPTTDCTST